MRPYLTSSVAIFPIGNSVGFSSNIAIPSSTQNIPNKYTQISFR